jgi:hypothetical protein
MKKYIVIRQTNSGNAYSIIEAEPMDLLLNKLGLDDTCTVYELSNSEPLQIDKN